jgi:hypothetical protein
MERKRLFNKKKKNDVVKGKKGTFFLLKYVDFHKGWINQDFMFCACLVRITKCSHI